MVTGRQPFLEAKEEEGWYKKFCHDNEFTDLISRMLHNDPERRISIQEIKKHKWMSM